MDINRNNYEAYFLDFAEGNLSSAEAEIVHRFLKFNPDLLNEFESYTNLTLSPETIIFPMKDNLKNPLPGKNDLVSADNFDIFCVALLEGDLSDQQAQSFEHFLNENSGYRQQFEFFRKTFIPEVTIKYPNKKGLKKSNSIMLPWKIFMPLAAAAAIALLFLIGPKNKVENIELASTIKPEVISEQLEEEAGNTSTPVSTAPATLKVIKGSKNPVPAAGSFNRKELHVRDTTEKRELKNEVPVKIAGIDLRNKFISSKKIENDLIQPVAIAPLPINLSSLSFIDLARYQFQRANDALEDDDVLLWNLASKGLKELNKVTGSNAQLLASKDEEGSISGIQFNSRYLKITAPIAKEE